jgi:hypothetical protein
VRLDADGDFLNSVSFDGATDLFNDRATIDSYGGNIIIAAWVDPAGSEMRIVGYQFSTDTFLYSYTFESYEVTNFRTNPTAIHQDSGDAYIGGTIYSGGQYHGIITTFDQSTFTATYANEGTLSFADSEGYAITAIEYYSNGLYFGMSKLPTGAYSKFASTESYLACYNKATLLLIWA